MRKHKPLTYVVCFAAALAGLLFGVDVGVITGAIPFIKTTFNLTASEQGLIVSAVLIGAVIGTLCSGFISRHYGRHFALILSAVIFTIGALLSAWAVSPEMLVGVRLFLGIALGLASFTAPLYLSEIAPKDIRGGLISLYQFMITFGILSAFISDTLFTASGNWRWMLGIAFVPAFIMFCAVLFIPKSPRWLMLRGRRAEAEAVLRKVRHEDEIAPELNEIAESVKHAKSAWDAFKMPGFMKLLLLGVILQLLQQFSGINAVIYYAPSILRVAGFSSPEQQMWWTVVIGSVNCLTTIVAIALIDKWGRRPVLFTGSSIIIVSLFILGLSFYVGTQGVLMQALAVICILTFIIGFAVSLGPIIWVLCSEIFPLQGRDLGITFSTSSNWICNSIVAYTFLIVLNAIGGAWAFWLFTAFSLFTLWFFYTFVPETRGVSLEHIEANLLAGKRLRELGA